jgi:hypothetical protein
MPKKTEQPESFYVRFARLAYALAQQVLPRYAHPKSPITTPCPNSLPASCSKSTATAPIATPKNGSAPARKCGRL